MTKPKILLDKNFLQGTSTTVIRQLATTHTLLMPDVLFYEMISCDEPVRPQCFAKLPPGENPIVLLQRLGGLLTKEMQTHKPCGLPSDNVEDFRFQFNPGLSSKGYELPAEAVAQLVEEAETLKLEVAQYLNRAAMTKKMFAEHGNAKGNEREGLRDDAEATIADFEQMRSFYKTMAEHAPPGAYKPPPLALVGSDWACVRLMQVQLLFGVDIWYRYGNNFPDDPKGAAYKRFEHNVLDANYLVLGVLQGSLATHEKKLRRWFLSGDRRNCPPDDMRN